MAVLHPTMPKSSTASPGTPFQFALAPVPGGACRSMSSLNKLSPPFSSVQQTSIPSERGSLNFSSLLCLIRNSQCMPIPILDLALDSTTLDERFVAALRKMKYIPLRTRRSEFLRREKVHMVLNLEFDKFNKTQAGQLGHELIKYSMREAATISSACYHFPCRACS